MDAPRILVVDGDAVFRDFCASALARRGYETLAAASGAEALRRLAGQPVALVVAEAFLPDMTGVEVLERIKAQAPLTDVVIASGHPSVETAVQVLKKGAADYLQKPLAEDDLAEAVCGVLDQRRLYQVNEPLRKQLRLYELSRSFAAIEEPSRVAELGLDAFLEMGGAASGVCVLRTVDEEGRILCLERQADVCAAMSEPVFEEVAAALFPHGEATRLLSADEARVALAGLTSEVPGPALAVAVTVEGEVRGFFLLFAGAGAERFPDDCLEDAAFLAAQIGLSFRAAFRFQLARGLAYIDSLTDLYNSKHLTRVLDRRIEEADRTGLPMSVLFLDLDNFREVNRLFGHQVGGRVLIEVGRILKRNVREEDTVIRYGGDEFMVVLPRADNGAAREIAERIRLAVRESPFLAREGKAIRITTSIGVATYPHDARNGHVLIHLADQAMFRGKDANRDSVYSAEVLLQR